MEIPETDFVINENVSFVKNGNYEIYAHPSMDPDIIKKVQKLGLNTIARNNWTIIKCDLCGNIQFFRPDLLKIKNQNHKFVRV